MAPLDGVPVTSSLKDIYGDELAVEVAAARFGAITRRFAELYGEAPELISRAPGRVNLIGEHIDYEGYSVLPMAILYDTLVAIRPSLSHTSIRLANINPAKYPLIEFSTSPDQELDTSKHHWGNYFLCGYKGVFDRLRQMMADGGPQHSPLAGVKAGTLQGLDVLVDGAVPVGSGLSSSAALVCASAVAAMGALQLAFSREEVADVACKGERYIGTQSGGMDQAIAMLARPGVAKLIDFNPLRSSDVVLPRGACFVVANSLAVSEKAVTAATNYNRRVTECRLASAVLAVKLGVPVEDAIRNAQTLKDVEKLFVAHSKQTSADQGTEGTVPASQGAEDPVSAVQALLHVEPYTKEEIEGILGKKLEEVFAQEPASLAVLKAASQYKLNQRATHVFSEARRVLEFRDVCIRALTNESADSAPCDSASKESDGPSANKGMESSETVLVQLGKLMDSSHRSCSELYECSAPELEELVCVLRKGGAYGARLTGAGWGGCAVALTTTEKSDAFVEYVKRNFYASRVERGVVTQEQLSTCIFASPPAGGAAIYLAQG